MTVIKPNSVAGINSITVQSGNSLAIHKSNGELLRTITGTTGVSTFSSISVGTAYTDNSAGKSINIGVGASISQHDANTLTFGTAGDPVAKFDANGGFLVGNGSNFTDSNSGNTKFIEVGTAGSGDALLVTHASGSGVGYFGYEAGGDRLVIACDSGSGNTIDFITDAGTTIGGGTDNLNGKVPKMRITAADGKVGVNTTAGAARLTVDAASGYSIIANGNSNAIALGSNGIILFGNKNAQAYGSGGYDATEHIFKISGSERLRINTSGQIGINTVSFTSGSQFESNSEGAYNIIAKSHNGNGGYHNFTGQAADGTITHYVTHNGQGKFAGGLMVDANSSQVLLGGNTAYANFENSSTNPRLQVRGTNLSDSCQAWIRATADAGAPKLFLANTRSTAEGGHTIVQNGDEIGQVHFSGSDGSQFVDGCQIRGAVDGTPGADDMPGRLTFHTTPDGSTSSAERMRIDNTGAIRFGTSSVIQSEKFTFFRAEADQNTLAYFHSGASSDVTGVIFRHGRALSGFNGKQIGFLRNDGTEVGSIISGNSSTSFNTSSDYRIKENQVSISDGITRLKTLKPYRFNFKEEPSVTVDGFFAHEVTAVPEAIAGTKDAVDSDNNPVYQGIDQSKLVPLLTAALQEAVTKIETLETKVAALEGG